MQRVLVTGGAGFIGSHTVDFLLKKGLNVVVIDNLSTGKLSNLDLFHPNLRMVQGDILDLSLLIRELQTCDAVLHLAALPSVAKSIENPIESLKINTLGFLHVLQAIREVNTPIRFAYASSAAIYGDVVELPCSDETHTDLQTLSPYALEKANNERYADLHQRLFGIKSLGLRYFNVYGTRQDPHSPYSGVISKFMEQYAKKEPITIFGDGLQSRDFIHVSDLARANWLALQSTATGVLNIATGVTETLNGLVSYLETLGGYPAEVRYTNSRLGDIPKSYASIKKASLQIGFLAEISLKEGIQQLLL
jgi:UDP-glucose 4-epimerase